MGRRRKVMFARLIGAGIMALIAPATIVLAQTDVPDLKGVWIGAIETVRRGEVFEHDDPALETTFGTNQFALTIERQDGRRFAGTWATVRATDPLIGMFRLDGKRLHMVDNDGTFTGELLGPDEMEVCRTEVTPHSMVISCGTFVREPEVQPE
jgi:hypothetical protein